MIALVPSPWWHLPVLLGLVVVLLWAGLGTTALTDRDEGANAEAAREMLEQRSWITPTLNYAPRFAKPALVYWLMIAAYMGLGVGEAAARLPSALAAGALVGLQYAFARWVFGAATAFRAALILLLGAEFVGVGRMVLTDAVLLLWTTLAGFAFFRAHHGPPPRGRWYAAMYLAMALGALTKGPVGVLVPVVGIVAYLALVGGWRRVRREVHPALGLALLLLVAGPWYAAMLVRHGEAYLAGGMGEPLRYIFRTITSPGGTVLFYVPVVLLGFFPWSAFLPGALVGALRGARARVAADRAGTATVFAAAWVAAVFVVFSLLPSRLPHYVAPLLPAAALLVAAAWPSTVPDLARGLLGGLGLLLGVGLIAAWRMGPTVGPLLAPAYPAAPGARLPGGVLAMGLLALLAGLAALVRDGGHLFPVLTAVTTIWLAVGLHAVLPAFSAEFVAPAGELVRQAAPALGPCDQLVVVGPYRPSLVFYARRPVVFLDARRAGSADLAARPGGRLVAVAPRAMVAGLPPALAALTVLDARGGYLLLAGSPAEGRCAT